MFKKLRTIAAVAASILLTSSCLVNVQNGGRFFNGGRPLLVANGNVITEARQAEPFTAINVSGRFDIEYVQESETPSIQVTASDNLISYVETKVSGKYLNIRFNSDSTSGFTGEDIRVRINYKAPIESISLSGSGTIFSNSISTEDFATNIAGSGDILLENVKCRNYKSSIAGSGNLKLVGIDCYFVNLNTAGSGKQMLQQIDAQNLKCSVSGSGDVVLSGKVKESTKIEISGSADVDLRQLKSGSLSNRVSGSGQIRQ